MLTALGFVTDKTAYVEQLKGWRLSRSNFHLSLKNEINIKPPKPGKVIDLYLVSRSVMKSAPLELGYSVNGSCETCQHSPFSTLLSRHWSSCAS